MSDNVKLVRRAWEAALAGDVDAVAGQLAAQVLELRELDERRVIVVLERAGAPEPHAQVVTVRAGKIAEMVVYPTASLAEA